MPLSLATRLTASARHLPAARVRPADGPPSFGAGLQLGLGVGLGALVVGYLDSTLVPIIVGGLLLACGTTSRHAARASAPGVLAGLALAIGVLIGIVLTAWLLVEAESAYSLWQQYRQYHPGGYR